MSKFEFEFLDGMAAHGIKCLRKDPIVYNRIRESMDYLGFFDKKVKAKTYGEDKKRGRLEVAICDLNSDIFVLTCKSNNPNDLYVIKKISEDEETSYDLSLLKKVPISNDNIDLCRVKDRLMSRHGRVFTDSKTFVSLYLHGYEYQMLSEFDTPIDKDLLLNKINSYENKPTFREFIDVIKGIVPIHELDNVMEVNAYKNAEKIYTIRHILEEKVKILEIKK